MKPATGPARSPNVSFSERDPSPSQRSARARRTRNSSHSWPSVRSRMAIGTGNVVAAPDALAHASARRLRTAVPLGREEAVDDVVQPPCADQLRLPQHALLGEAEPL